MMALDKGLSSIGDTTRRDELIKALGTTTSFMRRYMPDRQWFVVGGALRDSDMGRSFKDVDVFIVGKQFDALPNAGVDRGDRNAYVFRADTVIYRGIEINLIHMRGTGWTLESMTDRCDFGICQIGWCPEQNTLYRSDDYKTDKSQHQLTLCRDTAQERLQRMQKKYPWKLHNPSGFTFRPDSWRYDETKGALVRLDNKQ